MTQRARTLSHFSILAVFILFFAAHTSSAQSVMAQQRHDDRLRMLNWLAYQKAKADGKNPKKWWRAENSFGLAFTQPARYVQRSYYNAIPGTGQTDFDTVITGTVNPLTSFHANGNVNSLLVRVSPASIISFSYGIDADWLRWTLPGFNGSSQKTDESGLMVVRAGIPLTLDYKWGADVDWDRSIPASFAVGGGIMPSASFSMFQLSDAQNAFRTVPYLYSSVGFYAGICWKIRATFTPGELDIFRNGAYNYNGTINTLDVRGRNVFTIAIGAMGYSNDWGKGSAWREGLGRNGGGSRARRKPGRGRGSFDGGNLRMF